MTDSVPIRCNARRAAIRRAIPRDEQGYILLAAIFFLALLVISLAVAAPRIARAIQRDREVETFHRGMQYRRAVQLYYRKMNHTYPPNVDALVKTNEIRFLRKKYIDPMTGKDDWKPVLYGQNKTPTAMGFFGQPLSGNASTIAGVGPSGGNGSLPGTTTPGSPSSPSPIFGSSDTSSGQTSSTGSSASTDNSTSSNGTTAAPRSPSSATTSTGISGDATSANLTGQTFGGAGIIGFSPASPKQSILVYKKKNHYNEWEFTYDPLSDMQTMSGGNTGMVGQPASSTSTPIGGASTNTTTTPSTNSQQQ
jgi:type II secretory pathway pseudopilin PulG